MGYLVNIHHTPIRIYCQEILMTYGNNVAVIIG